MRHKPTLKIEVPKDARGPRPWWEEIIWSCDTCETSWNVDGSPTVRIYSETIAYMECPICGEIVWA